MEDNKPSERSCVLNIMAMDPEYFHDAHGIGDFLRCFVLDKHS